MPEQSLSDIRARLAPFGSLRAAVNDGNFLLVKQRAPTHEGVAPDLARELGRRLDVAVAFVGYDDAGRLPGARLRDGRFTAIEQAMGTPRDRETVAPYLAAFCEDIKASGCVAELITQHEAHGLRVAPPG